MIYGRHLVRGIALCLAICSGHLHGQGFPNVARTPGDLLTPLLAPNQGRTAVIAYHNGWLYTVPEIPASQPDSDYLVRRWDISDLSNVTAVEVYNQTDHPVMAHGYLKTGDYLCIGDNYPVETPFSFRAVAPNVNERTMTPGLRGPWDRGDLFQPWHINTYWTYNPDELDDYAVLSKSGTVLATWDHIGETGVIGHPFILGNLLIFASDQSRTGVATYDISDPAHPRLLDVLKTGGPGGYWPELWGGNGGLYIVFPYNENGHGMRVVDATDPADMRFVTDISLPGAAPMYVQFQDEYAFLGSHKVDMRTNTSVLRLDTEGEEVDTSQFLLPIGNLLATGGIDQNQGLAIWAHQAEPDTRGPSVAWHVPRAGETNYPVGAPISVLIHETLESPTITVGTNFIVRPVGGSPISGRAIFAFDDILTFTPNSPLLPDTTYEVVIPAGGIRDVAGNGIDGYSFTFSTGETVSGNLPPEVTNLTSSKYPVAPGETLTLSAIASDPENDPLQYRFDFGDGTPPGAWSSATFANYSYPDIGHYPAKVQVRDPSGLVATAVVTVTVSTRTAASPPTRSSDVVIDETRRLFWTVNPDNDTVSAVDADTLLKQFETAVGDDPRSVAIDSSGRAWIACHGGDHIDIVGPSGNFLHRIDLEYGDAPYGIVISPIRSRAYVSLYGSGDLVEIDTTTHAIGRRVPLGPTPRALALSSDGNTLYVSRFLSRRDYGEVWQLDPDTLTVTDTIRLKKLGGDDHRDSTAEGKGVPNYLAGLAVSPDGARLLVASNKMNNERGTLTGPDLDQDNTVRNIVTLVDTATGDVRQSIDIDNSDSASAVCFSPLGDYFFVSLQGNDDIAVFDYFAIEGSAGLGGMVSRQRVGNAPQGLCIDPLTDRLVTKNFLSRDLTVVELEGFNARGEGDFPKSLVSVVATENMPADELLGKRIFYHAGDTRMSGEGYLSCATCHIDGGHDGRTWDFTGRGEGLRNTTALTGRSGLAHGNVHWSANFDEIQDFEHDIRSAFGGTGFLTDTQFASADSPEGNPKAGLNPDLDALAAYVSSLGHETIPRSPHREADGDFSPSAEAGAAIFESEGCATCHTGPEMTDGVLHDVGTLRNTSGGRLGQTLPGIETPTLRGLWESAPYLHDGSAAELDDVFRLAGGFVVPVESAAVTGNASLVTEWTDLNNDGTVRGGGFVELWEGGHAILSGIDGGEGGLGEIELRYSSGYTQGTVALYVNGTRYEAVVHPTGNDPDWRYVNWSTTRVEGVLWNPGPSNTIDLVVEDPEWLPVAVDEITVKTAAALALAEPHRRVLNLPSAERASLIDFLLQLDGSPIGTAGPSPPPAPGNLRISRNDAEPPVLRWNPAPGATAYLVFRGETTDFGDAVLLGETTSSSFTDAAAGAMGTRYYWVVARNAEGDSPQGSFVVLQSKSPRPDLSIGPNVRDMIGEDIYSGKQVYSTSLRRRKNIKARFSVANDGGPDSVLVSASPGGRDLAVKYFQLTGGRQNVTSALTGGTLELSQVSSRSEPFLLRARHKRKGRRFLLSAEGASGSEPTLSDRVKIRLIVR